jgi:hypothetical protein
MKSKSLILTAMLTALPSVLLAQQNIQKAFDALLNENIVEIKTQHTLERDPETGKKKAQMDIYDFEVANPTGISRIKDIQRAFDKDKETAYELRSGDHAGNNYPTLAVGDGRSQAVAVGRIKGSNYIYACFLDKDDPEKSYRYAYALEWVEKDKKTQVRLAVTYATTLQYRNNKRQTRTFIVNGEKVRVDGNSFSNSFSLGNGFPFDNSSVFDSDSISFNRERSSEGWLSEFNTYKRLYQRNPDGSAANYYATYIYKLCKKADCLEDGEKQLVATEIKRLKAKTKDEFIQQLFDMGIERLKK